MSIILILAIVVIVSIFVFIVVSNYNFRNKQKAKAKSEDKPKLTNEQKKEQRLKKKEERIKQKQEAKEKKEKEAETKKNHFMSIHDVIAKGNINSNVKKPFQDQRRLAEGESDNINYIDVSEDDEYDEDFVKSKTNDEKQEKYEELKDEALADEIRGLSDEMKALLFGDVLDKKN